MHLVVVDTRPELCATLLGKAREAIRQIDLRRVEPVEIDLAHLDRFDWSLAIGCLVGPGCQGSIEEVVQRIRLLFPSGRIGCLFQREAYLAQGVNPRRKLNAQILAEGDLAQLASFIIDCESAGAQKGGGFKNRGVVGVCHFKGGVGATSVTAALASCWANHGLHVAAVDLDDVNPQLTAWARVGASHRAVTSELLRLGEVPPARMNKLLHPVGGFDGRFLAIGQPETYNESFHFKANVLEDAPSASDFIHSLISVLKTEFDAVILDMGRSWGVSTFAALPLCQQVVLVTDDDGMSVRRTLDSLVRLKQESDDGDEFDLSRWSLILNGYAGHLVTVKDLEAEVKSLDLFPPESNLFIVPFSERGRLWGAPGQTLYDLSDDRIKAEIRRVASGIIPFLYSADSSFSSKLLRRLQSLRAR